VDQVKWTGRVSGGCSQICTKCHGQKAAHPRLHPHSWAKFDTQPGTPALSTLRSNEDLVEQHDVIISSGSLHPLSMASSTAEHGSHSSRRVSPLQQAPRLPDSSIDSLTTNIISSSTSSRSRQCSIHYPSEQPQSFAPRLRRQAHLAFRISVGGDHTGGIRATAGTPYGVPLCSSRPSTSFQQQLQRPFLAAPLSTVIQWPVTTPASHPSILGVSWPALTVAVPSDRSRGCRRSQSVGMARRQRRERNKEHCRGPRGACIPGQSLWPGQC
jgi:hypothetical protein